jgi:hypothetical protein
MGGLRQSIRAPSAPGLAAPARLAVTVVVAFSPLPNLNSTDEGVLFKGEVRLEGAVQGARSGWSSFLLSLHSAPTQTAKAQQAAAWPHRKPLQRICRAKLEMALARAGGQLPQLHYPSDAISSERARLTSLCALSLDTQTWRVPGSMYERTYSNTVCTHVLYST